jgi:hypothetical protein
MPSYYVPSQGSHRSHHDAYAPQPVMYSNSHGYPHDGYGGSQYLGVPGSGYGQPIYVPSSDRSRSRSRSRRRHHHEPQIIHNGVAMLPDRRHHSYRRLTIGERIRRFFGFAPRHPGVKIQGSHSSWGFLGRSRRRRYVDAHTGMEVDKRGRPIYRV